MSPELCAYLAAFTAPARLALDVLVACIFADLAAWRANGSPTDGTMNKVQRALRSAVYEATSDARSALAFASLGDERNVDAIIAHVRRLAEAGPPEGALLVPLRMHDLDGFTERQTVEAVREAARLGVDLSLLGEGSRDAAQRLRAAELARRGAS